MSSIAISSTKRGFVERLSAFRERFGAKAAVCKALDVVLSKVLGTSTYAVVWLDVNSLTELAPADPRFTFRFLSADEIEEFAKDSSYYVPVGLADAVRQGSELCFAALEGDRLAAFGCYSLHYAHPRHTAGTAMSFPADVAYMSFGLTHPDFRGARLHGLIMGLALQELAKRGVTKFVSIVAWTNWASLKSCWRLGYEHLGHMVLIGGKRGVVGFYPRAAKQRSVRFGRKAVKPTAEA